MPATSVGNKVEMDLEQRSFPRLTGRSASVVGLGCWQLGGDWGEVRPDDALDVLQAAAESGVTFFDTADVYGDGRSEQLIGRFLRASPDRTGTRLVATKIGRRADPFARESYTESNMQAWVDRSRRNLGVEMVDLVQLHCPPTPVFADDRVFDALDRLVENQAIAGYGVSVETCAEALIAIGRPGVASVQIVFNPFRLKPLDEVLPAAAAAGVGVIARVPLASGLLTGRYTRTTTFPADDHRNFNAHGEAFDVGETFAGVDFPTGLAAADELKRALPANTSLAAATLRWITDQAGVTTVIPGARNPGQARANASAVAGGPTTEVFDQAVHRVYDTSLRAHIHPRW